MATPEENPPVKNDDAETVASTSSSKEDIVPTAASNTKTFRRRTGLLMLGLIVIAGCVLAGLAVLGTRSRGNPSPAKESLSQDQVDEVMSWVSDLPADGSVSKAVAALLDQDQDELLHEIVIVPYEENPKLRADADWRYETRRVRLYAQADDQDDNLVMVGTTVVDDYYLVGNRLRRRLEGWRCGTGEYYSSMDSLMDLVGQSIVKNVGTIRRTLVALYGEDTVQVVVPESLMVSSLATSMRSAVQNEATKVVMILTNDDYEIVSKPLLLK
jgi:hypothetical protein